MATLFNFSKSQFSHAKNDENNNFLEELTQNQRNGAQRRCSINGNYYYCTYFLKNIAYYKKIQCNNKETIPRVVRILNPRAGSGVQILAPPLASCGLWASCQRCAGGSSLMPEFMFTSHFPRAPFSNS